VGIRVKEKREKLLYLTVVAYLIYHISLVEFETLTFASREGGWMRR